jgi:iron complex outermembrane receptor protein
VEVLLQFNPTGKKLNGWISYAYNHYHFKEYIQDANNFSGNQLTGAPKNVLSAGVDFRWKGFSTNITANYVDRTPLNDANTNYAAEYILLNTRFGYKFGKDKKPVEVFAGVDNLFDQKYSLGNDLNARFGRYYNSAPSRNYYVGLRLNLIYK